MIYQGKNKYPVEEVILHTSATSSWWWQGKTVDEMRDEIDQWHKDREFRGIGYHFVVAPDGSWARGRWPTEIGAHVRGRNRGTIGICLVPKSAVSDIGKFSDYYTVAQKKTVKELIASLEDIQRVTGHNQYANKLCPGFKVRSEDWLPGGSFLQGLWKWLLAWFR